jgi:hypothetical protein
MFLWKKKNLTKREKSEEIKRELFTHGEVPVLVYSSSGLGTPLGSHP